MFQSKNKEIYFLVLSLFILSRVIIYYLDIYPDHKIFRIMWQVLDLNLLKNNFLSSLYFLHYQPPIWNFIIGILVFFFGTDFFLLSKIIHLFNLFISFVSLIIFFKFCELINLNKIMIFLISFFYLIFSLSYIFYENYLHYTHITTLIFLLFIYNYFKFANNFQIKYEVYLYLVATVLVYTWSAFSSPLFIILIFFTITIIKFKFKFFRSLIICIIFVLISIIPSIKNKIEFNFFGNSSWIGMQLVQVLKRYDVENYLCDMRLNNIEKYEEKFIQENNFKNKHPSLIGTLSKWNNVGMIYKTQRCLDIGINLVIENPLKYLSIVKFNFISTHGHFAFDHGFKPKNWNKYFGYFDNLKSNKILNVIKVRSLQLYYFFMYLFFLIILMLSLLKINNNKEFNHYKAVGSIFLIYLWMIVLTHMFAGFEQERMRHIGHFLHILFLSIVFSEIKNFYYFLKK